MTQNKIALITGASRGIGKAVALRYAKEGINLILVARTISALEEVDDEIKSVGGQSTLVPLDLTDYAKIDELGGIIAQKYGKLDILVGNAGTLGTLAPVGHISPKTWDSTFALNVTANYRLIRSFDSLLRQSEAGRAIFVSSNVTNNMDAYWGAYTASKSALEGLAKTYADEVKNTKVRVNIVDPGVVATKMLAEAMPGIDLNSITKPEEITDIFVKLAANDLKENGQIFKA